MHRSVTFNKSTEINAPPQVFLSLNEANGLELRKNHVFCLLSSNKIAFWCKSFVFLPFFHSSFLRYK